MEWVAWTTLFLWIGIALLPWLPWATTERLEALENEGPPTTLEDVTVIIPARNEADTIEQCLTRLVRQGSHLKIVLVDDRSSDGTAERAKALGIETLSIIPGQALPQGWTGKLWALEQGRIQVDTELTLLLDADIGLRPNVVPRLREKMKREGLQLASLMAYLNIQSAWDKLLVPAFVYFFKLLYPFRLSNSKHRWIAAAAGGCILLETALLDRIGGFAKLRNELIDDCALARKAKSAGARTWIGLTHDAISLRPYKGLKAIWDMVARTAFTQLHYSSILLALCTVMMVIAFLAPIGAILFGQGQAQMIGVATLVLMMLTYLPMIRFYRLPVWWVLSLPVAGTLYLAMTWTSALRYLRGERSRWKDRLY